MPELKLIFMFKNSFLNYQNIILCHLGGSHAAQLELIFFKTKLKMLKTGIKPTTPCHWKPIPLGYSFDFVVVRVIISLYYALFIDSV
jgi:hypothetical protein